MHATLLHTRIDRLSPELLRFLSRRCPEPEELMQEVWLRVARAEPDCPDDQSFRAYVYAVARRQLVDQHRRRAARVSLVPMDAQTAQAVGDAPSGTTPLDVAQADRVLEVVEATLSELKPEIAQVFRWRMTETLSFKDIAARQGVPLNTALGRHHRAVKAIGAALTAAGLSPEETR